MKLKQLIAGCPELAKIADEADDLHTVAFESRGTLREFLAASLSYMPGWMRFLYRIRWGFVRLLGVRQDGIPEKIGMGARDVPFVPGGQAAIFTVLAAEEECFWMAAAQDAMIKGYLGVVREPLENGSSRFYVISGARFLRRTGRLYYNVILPFHHAVVRGMGRAAVR